MIYSRIVGTGAYLPEKVLTNFDLEKMMDTTDEWIRDRTGIERRHIAADGETTVDLAEKAARRALDAAGVSPSEVDFIAFGTTTPDLIFPNCGVLLQARLGCRGGPAFSVETACAGFIYALSIADKFVKSGEAKCALVVGAETLSRITDWKDRGHRGAVRGWRRRRGAEAFRRCQASFPRTCMRTARTTICSIARPAFRGVQGCADRDHHDRQRGVQGRGEQARAGGG